MRAPTIIKGAVALVGCWYASLAVHEAGHALAGAITGAESIRVHLPLLGFSRTDLVGNTRPLLTTAAGLAFGAVAPPALWLLWSSSRLPGRTYLQLWSGFALILNGGYLAGDAVLQGGDSGELVRHGAPVWLLALLGTFGIAAGLWVWHLLGRAHTAGPDAERTS